MGAYTIKRLIGSIPILFIGLTLTFFLVHLVPGDPTLRFLDPSMGVSLQEQISEKFGLNEPLHIQYISWMYRIVGHFDFGNSFNNGRPASDIILDALPPTILVTGFALICALMFGMIGGIGAAIFHGTKFDLIITTIMLFFYSMPVFWLGIMLLGFFAVNLNWLPASQLTSVFHDQLNILDRFTDYFRHLALPVITLGLVSAATFGRYLRTSMIDAMNSGYVLAARARGISEWKILVNYGLRNALIPLITLVGMTIPALFSGAVIIEVVFSLPGMGRIMVEAVLARDYPVILAASTMAFVAVIIGNLLADIGYAIADPRVRLES